MSFEDLKQNIIKKNNQDMLDEIDRKNREVEPDNRQEIGSKNVNETTTNQIQKNINEEELPKFEDEGM